MKYLLEQPFPFVASCRYCSSNANLSLLVAIKVQPGTDPIVFYPSQFKISKFPFESCQRLLSLCFCFAILQCGFL